MTHTWDWVTAGIKATLPMQELPWCVWKGGRKQWQWKEAVEGGLVIWAGRWESEGSSDSPRSSQKLLEELRIEQEPLPFQSLPYHKTVILDHLLANLGSFYQFSLESKVYFCLSSETRAQNDCFVVYSQAHPMWYWGRKVERAVQDPLMTVAWWAAGVLCDRFPCVSKTQSPYCIDSGAKDILCISLCALA